MNEKELTRLEEWQAEHEAHREKLKQRRKERHRRNQKTCIGWICIIIAILASLILTLIGG